MKEREKIQFWDTSALTETAAMRERCDAAFIETQLKSRFPKEILRVLSVSVNETGVYQSKSGFLLKLLSGLAPIKGLPPYCEVQLEHQTGKFSERIVIWSPFAWNERFAGTAGGGTSTGGLQHITAPDNTVRGWTLPFALINGFSAATVDAGNIRGTHDRAVDPDTRELNADLIENWRARSTHWMTLFGKAVAEILHRRPVLYAYMNGGSGGGRQSIVEAQEFPQDYHGIWASCPAINWTKFVLAGFWPIAVMNSYQHLLSPEKLKFFTSAVHESVGGKDAYYRLAQRVDFDPETLVGRKMKGGVITTLDAAVMKELWNGPRRKNGQRLWVGFRPGLKFWNVGLPVGFYYTLIGKKPRPFFLVNHYARWITRDPSQEFSDITIESFEELFDQSTSIFANAAADQADLRPFAQAGGKLIIDHGLDDPLIPVDGTIDYYDRVCRIHGSKENVDAFCRLYLTPGDGHGSCFGNGPGITESDGLRALVNWVEQGRAPGALRVVQVKRLGGETICERVQLPY